jgi:uncharacterized protein YbgA (DUF1722 family)
MRIDWVSRNEELRYALDEAALKHTGRSLGDIASQQVLDDLWVVVEKQFANVVRVAELQGELKTVEILLHIAGLMNEESANATQPVPAYFIEQMATLAGKIKSNLELAENGNWSEVAA